MAFRIRKHGTVIAQFATPQELVVAHTNDSITLGDETNKLAFTEQGGVQCIPVDVKATSGATAANQTSGDQLTQLVDASGNPAEMDDVGGEKAIKVSVIASVGGTAAPAHVDDSAFAVGTSECTPIGALLDESGTDSVDEGDVGAVRMTADRILMIQIKNLASGLAIPVTDNGGALTVDGTVTAELSATDNAVLDNIATYLNTLQGSVASTHLQCDVLTIPNVTIGAEIPAGTKNIGDVDVLTLPAITIAAAQTLATLTTITNVVHVDDNGGALTVDGTVTANLSATDNAVLDSIQTAVETIDNAISGSEMQCDVITLPGVAGTAAHDAAASGNPVLNGLTACLTALQAIVTTANDVVKATCDGYGRQLGGLSHPVESLLYQTTAITNTSETTIVTANANNCLDIIAMIITNNSAVASLCSIKDSTAGTTRLTFLVPANGGVVFTPCQPIPQLAAKNNNWTATMGTTSTATNINVVFGLRPT